MYAPLIILFAVLFAYISWQRFHIGLALLFFLLPTYLIRFHIGPLPTTLLEVMIWIILLIWFIKILKQRQLQATSYPAQRDPATRDNLQAEIKKHPSLLIAIGLFLTGATLSIFTAVDIRAALGEWRAFYVEPILLFIVLLTTVKTKRQLHTLLIALILCGLLTSILAIYQHWTGWFVPYSFWANRDTYRVTAWYGFPNAVGLFLAPLVPLALYTMKQTYNILRVQNWKFDMRSWGSFILSLLFLISSLLAIVFAKSTGAMVGVAAGIGILLVLRRKTRVPVIILGVVGLVTLLAMPPNSIKKELLMQDRSGQLRQDIWAETIELLRDRPLQGAGLASYEERIAPYRIDTSIEVFHHPHNIFLTMWVNTGLIGLIGFVWVIVWFFRVAINNSIRYQISDISRAHDHRPPAHSFILAAMVTWVIMGLVDSPYIKNDLAILFWLLPTLLILATSSYTTSTSPN